MSGHAILAPLVYLLETFSWGLGSWDLDSGIQKCHRHNMDTHHGVTTMLHKISTLLLQQMEIKRAFYITVEGHKHCTHHTQT